MTVGWIEQRAQSVRVVWREDGAKQSEPFKDREAAERFRKVLAANGGHRPEGWVPGVGFASEEAQLADGRTMADAHALWVKRAVKASRRTQVLDRFRTMASGHPIVKALICDVTESDVEDFVAELCARYAEGTIGNLMQDLRAAFRFAQRRGWVKGFNPFEAKVQITTERETREPVFLRPDEVAALIPEVLPQYRLFVRVLFASGLRIGEAYALRVSSVMREGNRAVLNIDKSANQKTRALGPTKGRNKRKVRLPLDVSTEVFALAANRPMTEWLFDLPGYSGFLKSWRTAVKRAGLVNAEHPRGVRIHDTRHTHASDLLARGYPLFKVSRRLGHETIDITANTYGHDGGDDSLHDPILDA